MSLQRTLFTLGFGLLFLANASTAVLQNFTIDDTNGEITNGVETNKVDYTAGFWFGNTNCQQLNANSSPLATLTCLQNVDPSNALQATWTAIMINSTLSSIAGASSFNITFNGTAIYVYHIIPATNNLMEPIYGIAFGVDDEKPVLQSFSRSSVTQYNQLAYSRQDLTHTNHTLQVISGTAGNNQMVFDYAIYSADDGSSPSPSSSTQTPSGAQPSSGTSTASSGVGGGSHTSVGPIVGGVVGGIAVLAIVAALFLFFVRRRRRQSAAMGVTREDLLGDSVTPYSTSRGGSTVVADMSAAWKYGGSASFMSPSAHSEGTEFVSSMSPPGSAAHPPPNLQSPPPLPTPVSRNRIAEQDQQLRLQLHTAQETVAALKARQLADTKITPPNSDAAGSMSIPSGARAALGEAEATPADWRNDRIASLEAEVQRLEAERRQLHAQPVTDDDLELPAYEYPRANSDSAQAM